MRGDSVYSLQIRIRDGAEGSVQSGPPTGHWSKASERLYGNALGLFSFSALFTGGRLVLLVADVGSREPFGVSGRTVGRRGGRRFC